MRGALLDFNGDLARDTATFGDKTAGMVRMPVPHAAVALVDHIADIVLASQRRHYRAGGKKRDTCSL
jgi:hypothetical protein